MIWGVSPSQLLGWFKFTITWVSSKQCAQCTHLQLHTCTLQITLIEISVGHRVPNLDINRSLMFWPMTAVGKNEIQERGISIFRDITAYGNRGKNVCLLKLKPSDSKKSLWGLQFLKEYILLKKWNMTIQTNLNHTHNKSLGGGVHKLEHNLVFRDMPTIWRVGAIDIPRGKLL